MAQVTLKQLEALVQVADLGSFRRAAERLNTTQPNISARIAALEALLGHRLMARDAGSVTLTPRGEVMLARAREVLGAVDAFLVAASDDRLFDGTLRLGITEMIVHSWLGPYLAALRARFAKLDIALSVDLSKNLSAALEAREIDLALQNGPFRRQMTGMVALGRFPFTWVASPDLDLPDGPPHRAIFAQHPILTHARGTLPFDQIQAHIAGSDPPVRVIPSTNMAAGLAMTHQKLGIACVPKVMVQDDIASGRLVTVPYPWQPDDLEFFARFDADTAPHFVGEAARLAGRISHEAGR